MRIEYLNVIELNSDWGAEWFVNRGFQKNGHEPISIDYRKYRKNLPSKIAELEDFDVFLLQRGEFLPLELVESVKSPRFYWATELIARRRDQNQLIKSGLFDHVFVRGNKCQDTIVSRGWIESDKVSILLSGFDEETHKPMKIEKDIDVLFVGNITPRRQKILQRLSKKQNIEICKAYGNEMAVLINRSKIVLNIHAADELDTETRVFEVLGCGSFLLSEPLSKENPFIAGKHYSEADIDDFTKTISYYLEHNNEREKIAVSGNKEAWAKHSYVKRSEEIANVMSAFVKENPVKPSINTEKLREQIAWLEHPELKLTIIKYIQALYYPTASRFKKVLRWFQIAIKIILKRQI